MTNTERAMLIIRSVYGERPTDEASAELYDAAVGVQADHISTEYGNYKSFSLGDFSAALENNRQNTAICEEARIYLDKAFPYARLLT